MNFRKATDVLCGPVTHADVAKAVKKSLQGVRQARMPADSDGYRSPPPGWEAALARLARDQANRLLRLADDLEGKR